MEQELSLYTALDVFACAPDKVLLEKANSWLQDFQHSPEAWVTCSNLLLLRPEAPMHAKLFAAQTFRSKVTYDLHQRDGDLESLRDTLIHALQMYRTGPRTIITQLCLAISGLALQFPAWGNVAQFMIDSFGGNPATVPILLEFLKVLPEELINNTRIPVTDEEYRERSTKILSEHAKQVLDLLSFYNQASGVTPSIQTQIFDCLRAWFVAGEVDVEQFCNSPLFGNVFVALASDQLFDSAVDLICELIHETQEINDNKSAIELIISELIALKPKLEEFRDDFDKVKGLARIFAEAGETYRLLVVRHPDKLCSIVEAIGMCSAYPDLDIVPITFPFWMRLAQTIGKKPPVEPTLASAYKALMNAIIQHLHFPRDGTSVTSQQAENFRSFRHVMGDTLKDCCLVLGADACLSTTYHLVVAALSPTSQAVSWQAVEAPLFAMRSMGAEVDPSDDRMVPEIMELIQSLPQHPKIRYAALLIISRYTEWLNRHPSFIAPRLQYISEGFENSDPEVNAAAGQALKYLCQDCKQHLIGFLPTLHNFLKTTGIKLAQEDKLQVYQAISYVISAMPMDKAAQSLKTFSLDILQPIELAARNTTSLTKRELQEIGYGLKNLEVMLHVVGPFGDRLPAACQNACEEAWTIFDAFIANCVNDLDTTELTTRVLRSGLVFFGQSALSVALPVVSRMTSSFESTGFSAFLWIAGKIVSLFGKKADPVLQNAFRDLFERSTNRVVVLVQSAGPREKPDVLEDYVRLLLQLLDMVPGIFFMSPAFPFAFRISMSALTLVHSDLVFATLDLFRKIITHDLFTSLTPPEGATAIQVVVEEEGPDFVRLLLSGMVGDFPEDSTSDVVTIFCTLAKLFPLQLPSWLRQAAEHLPPASASKEAKKKFLDDVTAYDAIFDRRLSTEMYPPSAIEVKAPEKVKYAIVSLHRECRRARDRRRASPLNE